MINSNRDSWPYYLPFAQYHRT